MNQHSKLIIEATKSLNNIKEGVSVDPWRLQYHVAAPAYWINDPNGFCFYKGEYHLFYQHHPYSPKWGPMYWGHVKSKDLVFWEHLPIALAPSEEYDKDGCFSGSAIEKDGKLYLMYTGNVWTGENYDTDLKQVQCLAISEDGVHFEKAKQNPIIEAAPEGDIHPFHFRDPKVWEHEGFYYCVLGSRTNEHKGQALLYRSSDLYNWEFLNVAAKGEGNLAGFMWECPDIFYLDGSHVLMMSPQGMEPEGDLYHNLHQSGYVLGQLDYETGLLNHGEFELIDYGFDVYAPQTMVDDRGRRIMIAWMAMWESDMPEQEQDWAGAMTIPRELTMVDGKILSNPVAELEQLRENEITYENICIKGQESLEGVLGECLELDITLDSKTARNFGIKLRISEEFKEETVLSYDKDKQLFTVDREKSGKGPGGVRKTDLLLKNGELKIRIFVDHSSVEVFLNNGEKVMTARIYPSQKSTGIQFFADQEIELKSIKKWSMKKALD
jgi:beta-fructofuranosidase